MLFPCWFTLWTSGIFPHHYILLISIEIFLIFLFVFFFILFQRKAVQYHACTEPSNFFPPLFFYNRLQTSVGRARMHSCVGGRAATKQSLEKPSTTRK